MPSLISQMRNELQPPRQAMNPAVEQIKEVMAQIKSASNPQAALAQMLQSNPNTQAISQMLQGGGNLESIARQLAAAKGVDINQLIRQLSQN